MILLAESSFHFQNPLGILLLIPIGLLALRLMKKKEKESVLFSSLSIFTAIPGTVATPLLPIVRMLIPAGLVFLTIAFMRPQSGEEIYRTRSEGLAIAICLDRSGSMRNDDFTLNGRPVQRFDAVKSIFNDFVLGNQEFSGRPNDMIALVVFGGFVDTLCPLTLDHTVLAQTLEQVHLPEPLENRHGEPVVDQLFREESATAIGDALAAAAERLKGADAKSKVIVLLSDGAQNVGAVTAQEAAEMAKTLGIRVYTIGIGTKGTRYEPLEFDEETLKEIAKITDGGYFRADNTRMLENVCAKIDSLEKSEFEERIYTKYRELYRNYLIFGIVLILAGIVLLNTRFRSLPE